MKKVISILIMSIVFSFFGIQAYGNEASDETYRGYIGDGTFDGYNYTCSLLDEELVTCGSFTSWYYYRDKEKKYYLKYEDFIDLSDKKIIVPDRVNGHDICYINGSCGFRKFDLNPENKYMKCVDNVIFSKDGKALISYAQYDERTEYVIPTGTEVICYAAFRDCKKAKKIKLPNSVKEFNADSFSYMNLKELTLPVDIEVIPDFCFYANYELTNFNIPINSKLNTIETIAFAYCNNLHELYLPSFEMMIDRSAFGVLRERKTSIQLKSYVQPNPTIEGNTLKWDKISNASYYEIYQKLNNGEYKLLGKTKSTSHTFETLRQGTVYTFAVKPVSVIPAANYNKETDEEYFPETFTIEGTMSEDISVRCK
ncbi:MAG: leucine-rich repeat domain-containing protein [Oscillospiraceae bacterium]|nr:leucine-rich repeat domain-containing protein [Oscillospiraceae bacterium]